MAATAAGDYTLQQNNISGFAQAFIYEQLGLANCGLMQIVTDPRYATGNTWQVRGRIYDKTALQTPTADTDLTVNDITTYAETGVVLRRGQAYGIEDIAALAANDPNAINDYARLIDFNVRYGINYVVHNSLLPAMFNTTTTSILNGTHFIDTDGAVLESGRIQEGLRVWGEYGTTADGILMHSYVRSALYETGLISDGAPDLIRELETTGVRYGGKMSGIDIYVDDMCYAASSGSAGVYNTYLFKNGAMVLGSGPQLINSTVYRDEAKAFGTDVIKAVASFSPHVRGTTSGLTPTVGGGATDAEIATVTNWTKRTGVTNAEIGIVCIQSTEV